MKLVVQATRNMIKCGLCVFQCVHENYVPELFALFGDFIDNNDFIINFTLICWTLSSDLWKVLNPQPIVLIILFVCLFRFFFLYHFSFYAYHVSIPHKIFKWYFIDHIFPRSIASMDSMDRWLYSPHGFLFR